jgi:hypothetical protein
MADQIAGFVYSLSDMIYYSAISICPSGNIIYNP